MEKVFANSVTGVLRLWRKFRSVRSGERIGLVTHGGFLGAIFRYVLKIPLDAERNYVLLNCSINRFEKTDKGVEPRQLGDIAHLDGLDSLDDA